MAVRQGSVQKYGIFSGGLDTSSALDSPEIKGTLSVAKNVDYVTTDLLKRRNGSTAQFTAWSTRRIRGGIEYKTASGVFERLFYGESATTTGFTGILGKQNGTGAPTTITSNLLDNVKPSFAQFRSLLFLFNGRENLIYINGATRNIGITPPNNAPTLNTTVAGSLNTNGSYIYCYAYYNTLTGARSSPSPASSTLSSGTLRGIRINITAGDSSTADKIQIYRSVDGGSTFFREAQIAISSTTYDSTLADTALGIEMETDDSQLSEAAKYAVVADNRIFACGFASNPNRVHYSKIGIDGSMPESFQAADFIDCNINDGDKIVGIGNLGDTPIILKEFSVGRLVRTQTSAQGLERTGFPKYIYEQISTEVTGVSHHCMLSNDNVLIWLGLDDIYATDGVKIYRMGWRILETLKGINFTQSHKFSAVNKKDTKQIIFSVVRTGASEPDFQLVGDYKYGMVSEGRGLLRWSTYEPGPNTTTHPGLRAASLFEVTINKSKKVWFGSSTNDGLIYQMDTGLNDGSLATYFDVRLPWDGNETPNQEKMFHSYYILGACGGASPNNTFTTSWEENNVDEIVENTTLTFTESTAQWDEVNWNSFNWATASFQSFTYHPHRKAYFGRFGVSNTSTSQPMAIKGLSRIVQNSPFHR